jgi:hypothetical protein
MNTWYEDDKKLVHILSHVNSAKRAGRTACAQYIEFRPWDLNNEAVPTCLLCIGETNIPAWDDAVEERWEDVVTRCALLGRHQVQCDNDGYCMECGYQDDAP